MNHVGQPADDEILNVGGVPFTHRDFFKVIDDFYTRVQQDPLLQVPFSSVHDWPEHIQRLTHFWWIKFGGRAYLPARYNPVEKHFLAGFNREFLTRWLSLFHSTLESHLAPEQVQLWKGVSERMGEALTIKNEMFKTEYEQRGGD